MLYPKNKEAVLDHQLFLNPAKEYRGVPFWAWNTKMTEEHVDNTLSELKEMGMGGAFIHCRTGMDLPYLKKEFMDLIKYAHHKALDYELLTWLYDEDRWPSGFAGGLVTKEEKYRMRFLVFSPPALTENQPSNEVVMEASAKAVLSGKRKFLAKYAVQLNGGFLEHYRILEKGEIVPEGYEEWFAYLEISGNSAWFNNESYVNTLDEEAVKRFIEETHEVYYKAFGEHFGKTMPAIFTDEPQFSFKTVLGYANEKEAQTIPYTDDFEATYQEAYGESFLEHLPEIFWELPSGQISVNRYHYHDHVCERFTRAFADQVGKWCKEHHIMLTGHMMREPFLEWQTMALGEAMRSYRAFDIPGIDMLCDRRELTTAKQAQSAVHQYDCPGMMSEMYGVTNWDFDFRGHKLAGDWQAALGVTLRVHHLTWTSMKGEAKRDYPAPIGYQSCWYKAYSFIENYFARLNTALTRGKAEVKIGVIHPIESYWLFWGTREHTEGIRKGMDEHFVQLVKWLVYGLMDFDFISEALLESDSHHCSQDAGFKVGAMTYDVIVVPDCVTLRSNTLKRLQDFVNRGGKVIFAGNIPAYIDAKPSEAIKELEEKCVYIGFNENDILSCLTPYRSIDIHNQEGKRTDNLVYQMRKDGEGKWLFIAHSEKPLNPDIPSREVLSIAIEGLWEVTRYDPLDGKITQAECRYEEGKTYLKQEVYDHDSLLYYLNKSQQKETRLQKEEKAGDTTYKKDAESKEVALAVYPDKVPVVLAEPNVLVLDMAEYRLNDEAWQPKEEILRLDNLLRQRLGFPLRTEAFAQPWVDSKKETIHHMLTLRFYIQAECSAHQLLLALENAEETMVILNGIAIPSQVTGWYTDRDIHTVKLPDLKEGENVLEVTMPYYSKFNVEYMYLLGDFGVAVAGKTARITKPVRELAFGDICIQGLPFYGGNISYKIPFYALAGEAFLEATQFRCPVIKAAIDGEDKGYIAFSPYKVELGKIDEGMHEVTLTAYGNRINTFGPIHNCNCREQWIGPNAWRSTGSAWAYEYQLKPSGILVSPILKVIKD